MSLKLLLAVSFSDLFITIQYAVFRKSISTSYVSLYIYIYIYICTEMSQHAYRVLGYKNNLKT